MKLGLTALHHQNFDKYRKTFKLCTLNMYVVLHVSTSVKLFLRAPRTYQSYTDLSRSVGPILTYPEYLGNLTMLSSSECFPFQAPLITSCHTTHAGRGHSSSCRDETRVWPADFQPVGLFSCHHLEQPQ